MNDLALEISSQIQEERMTWVPIIFKQLNMMQKQYPHYVDYLYLEKTKLSLIYIVYNAKLRSYVLLQIFEAKFKINEDVRKKEINEFQQSRFSEFVGSDLKQFTLKEYYIINEDTKKEKIVYSNFQDENVKERDAFWIQESFLLEDDKYLK